MEQIQEFRPDDLSDTVTLVGGDGGIMDETPADNHSYPGLNVYYGDKCVVTGGRNYYTPEGHYTRDSEIYIS